MGLHKTNLFSKSELDPVFVMSRLVLSIDGCYHFDMLRTMVLVCLPLIYVFNNLILYVFTQKKERKNLILYIEERVL